LIKSHHITPNSHNIDPISFVNQATTLSADFSLPSHVAQATGTDNTTWILDSGAIDHICASLRHFSDLHPAHNISVKLLTGSIVKVTHIGTVKLTLTITLNNVFFYIVPLFSFNLISLSKLVHQLKCIIIFKHNSCFLQDPHLRQMIGSAKLSCGLYHLGLPHSQIYSSTSAACVLSNGHCSDKSLL
jgi:hypothetical protein